jgi:hypothetical protein
MSPIQIESALGINGGERSAFAVKRAAAKRLT